MPSELKTTEYTEAAAEAVALAKAALKLAKTAAAMMTPHHTPDNHSIPECGPQLSEEVGPTPEELELLEEQLSASIAVRSKRQVERKARRLRATEKAEAGVVSVKSGSRNRGRPSSAAVKPGVSRRRGEKKDVLAFLGGMTNAKLLTADEEVELSKGIQVLF